VTCTPNPLLHPRRVLARIVMQTLESSRPRKRLGQSFLVDPRGFQVFRKGIDSVGCADTIMELGSGPGLLSMLILNSCNGKLLSVEVDRWLAFASWRNLGCNGRVQVLVGDGVPLIGMTRLLVSNTPYHLTGRIIAEAARSGALPEKMVLGMQSEVAERVVARPGSRNYGRLTVISKLFFEVEKVGVLDRRWFTPTPKVDGAVLAFRRRLRWEEWMEGFEAFTACIFSQRNRLADKVLARCLSTSRDAFRDLAGFRVRDLQPETILEVYREWALGAYS